MTEHPPEQCREQGTPPGWAGPERRSSPRFEAAEYRMWLGWWVGQDFQTIATRLLDIGHGGAALLAPDPPPVGQPVWFCLKCPTWSGSARARVLGHDPIAPDGDDHRVRVEFTQECPEGLYEAAVASMADAKHL